MHKSIIVSYFIVSVFFMVSCSSVKPSLMAKENPRQYPQWFLYPELSSSELVCGTSTPGFYLDSSASQAYKTALFNALRYDEAEISGKDAFWATEAGVYWITTDFQDIIDSSSISYYQNQFSPVDTFYSNTLVAVAISKNSALTDQLKQRIPSAKHMPEWVEAPPKIPGYIYAMGSSPSYYYEKSSWDNAIKQVRKQLAVSLSVQIQALQKRSEYEGQEQRQRILSVFLRDFQILRRWIDPDTNIFYVLGRIPSPHQK